MRNYSQKSHIYGTAKPANDPDAARTRDLRIKSALAVRHVGATYRGNATQQGGPYARIRTETHGAKPGVTAKSHTASLGTKVAR